MLDEVDPYMEPAVLWLAQTILVSLLTGKLEAWIRQVGLAGEIDKLKSEVDRVEMVVAAVKGRGIGNKPLARSLARLKELLYDADDAVDELDYYRLQQQVEGANSYEPEEGMQAAEQADERSRGPADIPSSSGSKKRRSAAWDHFEDPKVVKGKLSAKCKYCPILIVCESKNGTSGMSTHAKKCKNKPRPNDQPPPNYSSTADGMPVATGNSPGGKRKRTDEESVQTTTITPYWDKAELSNRIQEITRQLQEIRGDVRGVLKILGSDSATSSTSDQRLRTSSLVQRKMYGRAEEQEYIIKLMAEDRAEGLTILPIVGIAGVGKTALAQHVYNDPTVEKQFERIWVWVSDNFDEVLLTREILDFVSRERHKGSPENNEGHEGISSFSMLQEILKEHMKFQSKRFLLILDDVWDNLDDNQWNKLLAPFTSSHLKGNVIIVTTRDLSVAQRIGTLEPVKLGALKHDDFWLLFKSHAFGDDNYEGHQSLSIIGQKIVEKLKGNPLAAKSTGVLLREKLETDHWSSILKNEDWKSMQVDGGIMPALKLSYDKLPYNLQQCLSYCSLFPYNHQFLDEELVRIWISQGFVKCKHSSQRLEEIGWDYLTDLVSLGFFQQEESDRGDQNLYAICGLMHDFARMVSRTECATIDGLQYNEMLPTIRHLSIVTDSAYSEDQNGNITPNKAFEKNLRKMVTSVRKLRTLVLTGGYVSSFFQLFQDIFQHIFQKAQNLLLLQMPETIADFEALMCSSVNPVHLRYFKCESGEVDEDLPQVLSKFYHLQVLDVVLNSYPTTLNGMNNLVSLRHLVADEVVHSSIGRIGQMTSLQELEDFSVKDSSGFEITQLQSMNELVHLGVSQLENIKSREEAYGAKLRDKRHLKKLSLLWEWNDTGPSCEPSVNIGGPSAEPSMNIEKINGELSLMDDSGPSSEPFIGTATEVLEGLEPNLDLKHLHIFGYNGTSPTWLANNITSLQTLHLANCGNWEILPSLVRLPFLTKLDLRNMRKVIEVLVPPLEELVLVDMPKLERCSCTSVWDLNSSLRVLYIKNCHGLEVFDLFENYHKFEIAQKSWLPGLQKLIMSDCPNLEVLNHLLASNTLHELFINEVSTLPRMKGPSSEKLTIGFDDEEEDDEEEEDDGDDDQLDILYDRILAFHNLRNLRMMAINNCQNLTSIYFGGFIQLASLKSLDIVGCERLFSGHVTLEDMTVANWKAFPSLERVRIHECGITAEWLSLTLRHAPVLKELDLDGCPQITQLLIEEEQGSQSNLTSAHAAAAGHPDVALIGSAPVDELNFISSLKNIFIVDCLDLAFNVGKKGLSRFTSLEKLIISEGPDMLWTLVHKDRNDDRGNGRWFLPRSLRELEICCASPETLQPCFTGNQTCLTKLEVSYMHGLKSLRLHSCTALEELDIGPCESLVALEGLQFLGSLKCLKIYRCPSLRPCLERLSMKGPELCPRLSRLETLSIPDTSLLTTSFCKHLSSLQCLKLSGWNNETTRLTDEQELALQLLTSLQELEFRGFEKLVDLPAALNRLTSLKKLQIRWCHGTSRLPVTGLPHSLEKLEIKSCSQELTEECRNLATRNLKVKINWEWIN